MTTKNDLLERYLQAVGEYLPMMSKADTLAELRANLLDQMEAREDELGRELTQDDMAALLRAHGKPELVALRYLPQRSLIGPTIFPFYVYTLRKALPLVLLAYAVASGATLMSEAPTGDALVAGLARAVFHVVPTLIYFVGVVTVVFAMLEASKSSERVTAKLSAWDPLQMEKVRDESGGKQKSFVARLVDLGVHILWMAYVLALPRHPFWILGPGTFKLDELGVGFAPVWHTFYALLIVLLALQLWSKLWALKANAPASWARAMNLATNALGVLALAIVAFSQAVFVPVSAKADLAQVAEVNHAVLLALRIALLFAVAGMVKEAWQLAQKKTALGQLAF